MEMKMFLAIVNRVTVYHRHGKTIPKKELDALCNAQIEMEKQLQNTSSNSDYTKCTAEIFKYVTDNICNDGITKKEIKVILKKHFA